MKDDKEFNRLVTKYPYIVAWCKMLGSYKYYIHNQLIEKVTHYIPVSKLLKLREENE